MLYVHHKPLCCVAVCLFALLCTLRATVVKTFMCSWGCGSRKWHMQEWDVWNFQDFTATWAVLQIHTQQEVTNRGLTSSYLQAASARVLVSPSRLRSSSLGPEKKFRTIIKLADAVQLLVWFSYWASCWESDVGIRLTQRWLVISSQRFSFLLLLSFLLLWMTEAVHYEPQQSQWRKSGGRCVCRG